MNKPFPPHRAADTSHLIGREPVRIKHVDPKPPRRWSLADLAILAVCVAFFLALLLPHVFHGWSK